MMFLSIRPTRPFGHSDLPTLPPAPTASPRLRRAAGKKGRLATDHPATHPAASPRASPDRNVLMYLRTGSAGPTPPRGPHAVSRPRGVGSAARIVGRRRRRGLR